MLDWAKKELERIEKIYDDDFGLVMQKHVTKNVMDLMEVFCNQGHSGHSANYVAHIFDRLVHYRPLTPLTGEDDEWNQLNDGSYQNKRCSNVFKTADGRVYDMDYWYIQDEDGCAYSNRDCKQDIVFPYLPEKPKRLEYPEWSEEELNKKEITIIKECELVLLEKKAKELKEKN